MDTLVNDIHWKSDFPAKNWWKFDFITQYCQLTFKSEYAEKIPLDCRAGQWYRLVF